MSIGLVDAFNSNSTDQLQGYLLDFLGCVRGPEFIVRMLSQIQIGTDDDNVHNTLSAIARFSDIATDTAADAAHVICNLACNKLSTRLIEQSIKALWKAMEVIQTQIFAADPETNEKARVALRAGVDFVLSGAVRYQKSSHGRWPAMTARALRAAAYADERFRKVLAEAP